MKIPILKQGYILTTSIQVELSDQDALDFQNDVLEEALRAEASGIVIDITALDVVDSFMARVLNDTANMVRMLGTECVIAGMRPAVALTLVEMGRKLIGVEMTLNLEQGIDRLRKLIEERGAS